MVRVLTGNLRASVVESGRIVTRVEVYDARRGEKLLTTDPDDSDHARMKVVSGSISTDETRGIAGTGTAQLLVDEETASSVLPLVAGAALSPTAPVKVQVSFAAVGDAEHSNYGMYEVDTLSTDDTPRGVLLNVEVSDNSRKVERARFWRPESVDNRTPYESAFHTLLDDVLPESQIQVGPTTARTGLITLNVEDSRLSVVNQMATAIGFQFDWNADGTGNVDIMPATDTQDEPVWTFVDGGNAKVTSLNRVLTDERSYNGVIAMGEATGSDTPPVRAEAWDLNPSSPTYFDPSKPDESIYGPVPFFYVSQFITTQQQAQEAAQARLPKVIGLVEVLRVTAVPHPGIVPGDPIKVERPSTGVTGVFVVESVEMPLTAGRMTIVCRDRRILL